MSLNEWRDPSARTWPRRGDDLLHLLQRRRPVDALGAVAVVAGPVELAHGVSSAARCSLVRQASARMVSTGLTPPLVTCSEPSAMVTPVVAPDAAPRVGHRGAGVAAHAAAAGLVLARAGTGGLRPQQRRGRAGAAGLEPLVRALAQELGAAHVVGLAGVGEQAHGGHAVAVGDRGLERDARAGGGHLLDRPDDQLGARVGLAERVGARLAPGRDDAGGGELRVRLDRDRDELVGEDAAAEDAVVVVAEVGGRDQRPGPDRVLHELVEEPTAPA